MFVLRRTDNLSPKNMFLTGTLSKQILSMAARFLINQLFCLLLEL